MRENGLNKEIMMKYLLLGILLAGCNAVTNAPEDNKIPHNAIVSDTSKVVDTLEYHEPRPPKIN